MTTGAFFDPNALWGSTSGEESVAWLGRGAASAASGDVGNAGRGTADEAAGSGVGPGGGGAMGGGGTGWKEGSSKAPKTSKVTLMIATKIRLRFTPSSKALINDFPEAYRILPRNRVRGVKSRCKMRRGDNSGGKTGPSISNPFVAKWQMLVAHGAEEGWAVDRRRNRVLHK